MITCEVYPPETVMMIKMQDIWCTNWELDPRFRSDYKRNIQHSNRKSAQCDDCSNSIGKEELMREFADLHAMLLKMYNGDLSNAAIRKLNSAQKTKFRYLSFRQCSQAEKLGWRIYKIAIEMEEILNKTYGR